jgi:pyruvate formate lyase activating enzyme
VTFKGWQKTSLIEYPGRVSSVLFVGGCNFRCPFCYNPSLVLEAAGIPDLGAEVALDYLAQNRRLYQAVVVSGGEPTLHPGLAGFLERVGELGLERGLATNGSRPDVLRDLLAHSEVEYVAMDVKAPLDWEAYRRAAGLAEEQRGLLEKVRESIELLREALVRVELRCTVVPGLHGEEDLVRLAGQLAGSPRFALQAFQPARTLDPAFGGTAACPGGLLQAAAARIRGRFSSFEIRS